MKTITMDYDQYERMLDMKKQGLSLLETMAEDVILDFVTFDSYWLPLSEEDFAQAWLYPNSVNVTKK